MKHFSHLLFTVLFIACASPASAQMGLFGGGDAPKQPTPSNELPPLPQGAPLDPSAPKSAASMPGVPGAPQPAMQLPGGYNYSGNAQPGQPDAFPALPPSRACTQGEIMGMWKLVKVYESPQGAVYSAFTINPSQYMLLRKDGTYGRLDAGNRDLKPRDAAQEMKKQINLMQYLLHESGVIYFYQNGAAIDTQACFIVANDRGDFRMGQLILMPPEGQSPTRIVRVYQHPGNIPRPKAHR